MVVESVVDLVVCFVVVWDGIVDGVWVFWWIVLDCVEFW